MSDDRETLEQRIQRVVCEEVAICPYDACWAESFRCEEEHLRSCLPAELLGRIEHFGSTAVPGLAAKPIVDMLVEVRDLQATRERIAPLLEAQGYEYFWHPPSRMIEWRTRAARPSSWIGSPTRQRGESMKAVQVVIRKYVDNSAPGWVEVALVDAFGREVCFTEKVPVVSMADLTPDSPYPQPGVIACEVVETSRDSSGREVATICTEKPWGVESVEGETTFMVFCDRLVEI